MITLDATLQTNQDGNVRHPLVEVKSYNAVDDIPFDGQQLTSEVINESGPSVIVHSSGRLMTCYIYGPDGGVHYILRLTYTDVDRQQFQTVDLGTAAPIISWCSLCELASGNVGVAWIENDVDNHLYRLKRRIITEIGVNVSTAEIANWSHDTYTNGLSLIYNSVATTYQLVYAKISGSNYGIYLRTSTDFIAWGAESALSIGGLTATHKIYSPVLMEDAGHSTLWLWFAYVDMIGTHGEELVNVYYATSTNNGTTWLAATKFTAYDAYSEVGQFPMATMKSVSQMYAAHTATATSLVKDETRVGHTDVINLISHFDPVRRKLYIGKIENSAMDQPIVQMIDVDTWEVEKTWCADSTPSVIGAAQYSQTLFRGGSGDLVVVCDTNGETSCVGGFPGYSNGRFPYLFIQLINSNDNTVTTLSFAAIPSLGIMQNVTGTYYVENHHISTVQVDETNNRLWLGVTFPGDKWGSNYLEAYEVGYIDLSNPASYTYTSVLHSIGGTPRGTGGICRSRIFVDEGYIIISRQETTYSHLAVYLLTGELVCDYKQTGFPDFPDLGANTMMVFNGKYYGDITYTALYNQQDYRGIVEIDLATEKIRFHCPTFATADNYYFNECVPISETELLFSSSVYGAAVFDTVSLTWRQISNTTDPGLTTPPSDAFYHVVYDETGNNFFIDMGLLWSSQKLYCIPLDGLIKNTYYKAATYFGGEWTWGTEERMILGNTASHISMARWVDGSSTYLYAVWEHDEKPGSFIFWDVEEPPFDLTPYWILDTNLSLKWSIDGSINTMEMTLSHGHLFDSFNTGSAWQKYADKGRKLIVRLGELISGMEYWQNQGTYIITERKMSGYERGKYPTITITAEDKRCLWQLIDVIATDYYTSYDPDAIVQGILIDHDMAADSNDFDWEVIDNETQLDHQWTETPLLDVVTQIVDRYGYYLFITVDDKISARKIALNNPLDHAYLDNTRLLSFSPDDSFSDFTNKVIVIGQERTFTEVTYDEERIKSINGTVGWWGYDNEFTVYYSEDKSRVCRYPRLKVIESATSIGFVFSGDIEESITYIDVNELYCIVTVKAPDLTAQLIAWTVAWALFHFVPDMVVVFGFIASGGVTIRVGTALQAIALFFILNTLSAVGNFQYEIWAQPIGHVRRSIQATADDEDCQNAIGKSITKKIEDPLCYTVSDCQFVANHERDVVKAQRRRASITKISHLQDEVGDTISIPHPFSNKDMSIFITDITRTYRAPNSSPAEEASCVDEIEGWVL